MTSYEFLGSLDSREFKELQAELNQPWPVDFNGNPVYDEEESLESLMVVEDEFGDLMWL